MEKFSANPFLKADMEVFQPESGYRFSEDPFILASQIELQGHEKIIDIGTGSGIIPLLLSSRYPDVKILGIEIQKELFECARKNVLDRKLENSIRILHKNITNICPDDVFGPADIIVSNPPYKKKGAGRLNPDSQKALARHEITLSIDEVFKSADTLLKPKGSIYIIFPAERIEDLLSSMTRYQFSACQLRFVHTKKDMPAKRVVLHALKDQTAQCSIAPPLYFPKTIL